MKDLYVLRTNDETNDIILAAIKQFRQCEDHFIYFTEVNVKPFRQ